MLKGRLRGAAVRGALFSLLVVGWNSMSLILLSKSAGLETGAAKAPAACADLRLEGRAEEEEPPSLMGNLLSYSFLTVDLTGGLYVISKVNDAHSWAMVVRMVMTIPTKEVRHAEWLRLRDVFLLEFATDADDETAIIIMSSVILLFVVVDL